MTASKETIYLLKTADDERRLRNQLMLRASTWSVMGPANMSYPDHVFAREDYGIQASTLVPQLLINGVWYNDDVTVKHAFSGSLSTRPVNVVTM